MINDFKAQAHGCRANLGQAAQSVLPGEFDPAKVQVVVGAGTGFGKAALAPLPNGGYIVLPSEGGHSSLSFVTPEEFDFFRFACSKLGESYIRGDSLLSGSGLSLLHLYLSGLELSPPEVLAAAGPESPTLAWFARFFGRAARNYVLDVLGLGGLFVSGGVAAKNPHILAHPEFAAEFRLSPTHGDLLAKVGVKLNLDEELGLYGAALLASELAAAKGN